VFWILALLLVYSLLMKLVPVPGYGAGVQEPTGNLAWYLDSTILEGHTWSGAPVPGFDPEGILSTLPAIATTLFGILTGHLVRSKLSKEEKTIWMFVGGNIFLLVGVILDMWFPINKNLWSTSYSVFMAGWALICLGVFYWFIDVKGYKRWAQPFVIYGMNAIAAFMLAGLIGKCLYLIKVPQADGSSQSLQTWIYQTIFLPLASPINASLLYAITFVIVLYLITWIMWRKKWFIKV
jgi:predicted acyltransferase